MIHTSSSYKEKVSQLISWGHWFSLFNIFVAMILGSSYIALSNIDLTPLSILYALLSWVGHFSMLVFIGYLTIIFPLTFILFSQRVLRIVIVLLATIAILVLLLDIYTFATLHMHLNKNVIELIKEQNHQNHNSTTHWSYLFFTLPFIFIMQFAASTWIWKKQHRLAKNRIGLPITIIFIISLASSHVLYAWADAYLYQPIIDQESNLPLSYPMTARRFLERHGFLDKQKYVRNRQLLDQTQQKRILNYPAQSITIEPISKQYNVLILMVNGLRADAVSSITMPFLNKFADNHINFPYAYSGGSYRNTSLFSLLYGLPNNYQSYTKQLNTQSALLTTLKTQQYQLASFTKTPLPHIISQQFHSNNRVIKLEADNNFKDDGSDMALINQWQTWIEQQDNKPWFSYLELNSVEDYQQADYPQKPFQPAFNSELAKSNPLAPLVLKNTYYNASYFSDHLIQIIIEQLEKRSELDHTIVIISSAYGIDFERHEQMPYWGLAYRREKLHIPLIIHWPQKKISIINQLKLTSQLDIAPTVMTHLLQSQTPIKAYSTGADLFESINNTNRSWVLSSDSQSFAIIEKDQTTVINDFGNSYIFDENNKFIKDAEPKLSTIISAGNELQRFLIKPTNDR